MGAQIFRTKDIDKLISDSQEPDKRLKKSLGAVSLTSLGIGAVIGSGIFTVIGTAIAGQKMQFSSILNAPLLEYLIYHSASFGRPGAGPAIALSFILVAIACGFAALCYAELAAMIPIAGSAYTYTYATMGELIAWIIGWDLILEYAVSNMAVSVGFSAHVVNLLDYFGIHASLRWISPAYLPAGLSDLQNNVLYEPGWHFGFNLPAFIIVMILTMILVRGIRESAETNNVMVILKIVAILVFITFASRLIHPANWHPFAPNGWPGILTGGSIVFFTYIGFDSVSTAAEECKNPQRDLPIGILATLIICTVLYIGVVVVLTGLVPWQTLLGRCSAGRQHDEKAEFWLDSVDRVDRRPDGHDFVVAGVPAGAGARLVRDVARWALAEAIQPGSQTVPHTRFLYVGCRFRGGNSGRATGHRNTDRSFEYRHAVCVRLGCSRCADPSIQAARAAARISCAGRFDRSDCDNSHVRTVDGGPSHHKLDSILPLADNRAMPLLFLRASPQPASDSKTG